MKSIQAVLVHNYLNPRKDPVSILSFLIRIFSFSKWNHLELLIEEDGEKYMIGAVYPKVRKVSYDVWEKQLKRIYEVHPIPSKRTQEEMIDTAKALVGSYYDRDSLLIFLPFYLIHRVWLGRINDKAKRGLYCYEVLAYVAGWPQYHKITPRKAHKYLTGKVKV